MHLTMRKAAAGAGAACFSDSPALSGPVPGSSYAGACLQYPELIMATVATKEVMAYRIQAGELGYGPRAPTPLYLDATAVLHGTATEQVSREMKYLAAKLAIFQQARAHG